MKLSSAPRNLFSGMMLALVTGLSMAPMAIALPTVNSSTPTPLVLAQASPSVTATVLETDIRDDMVRVQLANGSIRTLSIAAQNIVKLGLTRGAEVTLNMNGTQVLTMTHNAVTVTPHPEMTAVVEEIDTRDDMVRVRLTDGSSRTLLLAGQDILNLGLRNGSEVMLNMDGNRVVTMSRMVSVQPLAPVTVTIVELDPRNDKIRVRLPNGSTRNVVIATQDISRLGLSRGSQVMVALDNDQIVTMFTDTASVGVSEVQ